MTREEATRNMSASMHRLVGDLDMAFKYAQDIHARARVGVEDLGWDLDQVLDRLNRVAENLEEAMMAQETLDRLRRERNGG